MEQWIRAKYERQEFTDRAEVTKKYEKVCREDPMMKRGKNSPNYKKRLFILDQGENTIRYYNQAKVGLSYILKYFFIVIIVMCSVCGNVHFYMCVCGGGGHTTPVLQFIYNCITFTL